MAKKITLRLGEDGLPLDDVRHYAATPDHLRTFDQAAELLHRFKAPSLLDRSDPHSHLIVGLMDGTGNDVDQDPIHATNVAKFRDQIRYLRDAGEQRLHFEYIAGPGTQDNALAKVLDGATGRTSLGRAEEMYGQLLNQAQKIYQADPDARIAFHLEGFSRGASQVPLLARMIDGRGIPDLDTRTVAPNEHGTPVETFTRHHQAPGKTPMSVGLYDPVPTGYMEVFDRQLPSSVVSGFQISAMGERRWLFRSDQILPQGASADGRFLHVGVAGAHSDIGGGYLRDGLAIRSFNLMTDYHNRLLGEPLLERLHEPADPRLNVIHRSEQGMSGLYRLTPTADRALPEGQVHQLAPDHSRFAASGQMVHLPAQQPEAMSGEFRALAGRAQPALRSPRVSDAALTEGDALLARLAAMGNVELRPHETPFLDRPGVRAGVALGAAGVAAGVADAIHTGNRVDALLAQDNLLGARHEMRDFAISNANAWAAAWGTAKLGAELGGTRRGVHGGITGGVAGGIVGYVLSDRAMAGLDGREIANQRDAQGREWTFNRREWVRPMAAELDGETPPRERSFSADFDTRRELDYRATSTSVQIALRRLPPPRDPFVLKASDEDTRSVRPSDWARDAGSGQWQREVVLSVSDRGLPLTRMETASPERTMRLDRQAAEVVEANIANGPAALAARYNVSHQLNGWETLGPVPPAVRAAHDPDSLYASDGRQYRLGGDGGWRYGETAAAGNLAAELSLTRQTLQPMLERHARVMELLPDWQRPTRAQQDLSSLVTTYAGHGIAPNAETMAAILQAVDTTRARHGIDASNTSLALDPGAQGQRDVNSPIMHLHTDSDGVVRAVAVTTAEDIERARGDLHAASRTASMGRDAPATVAANPDVERFLRALEAGDDAAAREASKAFANSAVGEALAKAAEERSLAEQMADMRHPQPPEQVAALAR